MSGPGVLTQVRYAAVLALQQFIPPAHDREALTWQTFPQAALYLIPFFFMAFLVRRQETHLIRLLLLPTVVCMALQCTFRFRIADPRMGWFEWDRGLLALGVIAKAINYASARDGRFKMGETELSPLSSSEAGTESSVQPNHKGKDKSHKPLPAHGGLVTSLCDALEVSLSMRGLGWDFGHNVYIPLPKRPVERAAFIPATIESLIRNIVLTEVIDTIIKLVPGVTPTGGTIFLLHLPLLQRYVLSTILHLSFGLYIFFSVAICYDMAALFGVILLGHSSADWPPVHGDLSHTRSLHEFWSRGWHQALRHVFLTLGGFPGGWIAGRAGTVFGTFLASGLFHEIGLSVAGKEMDHRVTAFFLLQAVGIVFEEARYKLTGRRLGGVTGTAWTALFVLGFGQMCTDSWFNRGIAGATTTPIAPFSPVRPVVRRLVYLVFPSFGTS